MTKNQALRPVPLAHVAKYAGVGIAVALPLTLVFATVGWMLPNFPAKVEGVTPLVATSLGLLLAWVGWGRAAGYFDRAADKEMVRQKNVGAMKTMLVMMGMVLIPFVLLTPVMLGVAEDLSGRNDPAQCEREMREIYGGGPEEEMQELLAACKDGAGGPGRANRFGYGRMTVVYAATCALTFMIAAVVMMRRMRTGR